MDGGFASRISCKLARQANDFEGRVAIKRKELSQPASFLILAELYKEAGQDEQAFSWAERRNRIISWPACPRLREFLITEYESRGWTEKAAELQKK